MRPVVVDTSVYLAMVFEEPGFERAETWLDRSLFISTVNVCEVAAVLRRKEKPDSSPESVEEQMKKLRFNILPFSLHHALVAANFISATRNQGLSLGDCACLAIAKELDAVVLTADRGWKEINLGIAIEYIR